jgi:hypothetical protein
VTGPLEAFQGRQLNEDRMRRLIHDLSRTRDEPLPADRVNNLFDRMWPDLKTAVDGAQAKKWSPTAPLRDQRDMIEELVDRVRRIDRNAGSAGRWSELFPNARHIFLKVTNRKSLLVKYSSSLDSTLRKMTSGASNTRTHCIQFRLPPPRPAQPNLWHRQVPDGFVSADR